MFGSVRKPAVTYECKKMSLKKNCFLKHNFEFCSDPSSILGGVRLPPDTEIIKYTSSIVGPKIPGTTNRGRKKTISLDTPSVSVHPPHSPALNTQANATSSLMMESRKFNRTPVSIHMKKKPKKKQYFKKTNNNVKLAE